MFRFTRKRREADTHEREHDVQLRQAEAALADLKVRGERAIKTLDARHGRNHWREAIEELIQGI